MSFHVDAGETLALVGESGAGKSITALSIMRLVRAGGGAGAIRTTGELLLADEGGRTTDLLALSDVVESPVREVLRSAGFRALIGVPLIREQRILGVLKRETSRTSRQTAANSPAPL